MSANAVISSIWQPFNRMNSRKLICLAALAIALQSCRTGPPKIQTPFNPLSVGPTGPTLKKFLDRGVSRRMQAIISLVKIQAFIPSLDKQGEMLAEQTVQPNGHISYEMKSFAGDNIVKTKVIGIYLSAEQEASEAPSIGINALNYKFKFKRRDSLDDRTAVVYELNPIKNVIGLFKGELWLEESTGLELRQFGRLVKNPSVIFKTADFTRDFKMLDGVNYLAQVAYQANTRIIGRVNMQMQIGPPRPISETGPRALASRF